MFRVWFLSLLFAVIMICPLANGQSADYPKRLSGTSAELLGADAQTFADTLPVDDEVKWQVFVPDTYDSERPAGLFVYISPTSSGRIPPRWRSVMEEHNLIYIAAIRSGNQTNTLRRILYALMAPRIADETFALDPSRIYVSGFSGGGRTASYVSALFPETFVGGLYICGVEYGTQVEAKPQFHDRRHVLLTGHDDFNRQGTKDTYVAMEAGGVTQLHLMDIPNYEHELPRARHLNEALAFLDTGLVPE